jgi:DNA modification methylase
MTDLPTDDDPVRIITGDVLDGLRALPDGCARVCVTSPPYYGQRDYKTARWEGGDPACDHRPARLKKGRNECRQTFGDGWATHGTQLIAFGKRQACDKCGAVKVDLQIGLEPSPDEYVARLVDVFREVRRILAADGTLWLNLGDSYANDATGPNTRPGPGLEGAPNRPAVQKSWRGVEGVKKKDLLGIPWMVAFALRADAWYLRQELIWNKPNARPEPVRDRCTKSHEHLFLLSKSPRYYFDRDAMQEPASRRKSGNKARKPASARGVPVDTDGRTNGAVAGSVPWEGTTRNKRSVWTIPTRRYRGAHFATFPENLVRPCVLAGSAPGDLVLDPFAGSGTTLAVAARLGRRAAGVELNPDYAAMARERVAAVLGRIPGSLLSLAG